MPAHHKAYNDSQVIDRLDFTVFGQNGPFRESSITQFFNPSNASPPFFQVFDPRFLSILGPNPSIRSVASNPTFAFAHEAPIWLPETDEVTFASGGGGPLGMSDINHNNQVGKISLKEVQEAIKQAGPGVTPVNVTATKVRPLLAVTSLSTMLNVHRWFDSWTFQIPCKLPMAVQGL